MIPHLKKVSCLLMMAGVLSSCSDSSDMAAMEQPKVQVTVFEIQPQRVALSTELPARTAAVRIAEVRPQVSGIIQKRLFTEGSRVEAGQQLYQIEADLYQAEVATARANLQRAEADLKVSETREQRFRTLVRDKAISQQEYDEALATFEQAKAEIAVRKATLDTALINLRYTQVDAPIDGQIGVSAITEGALVSAGQAQSLASIHQLDPIYVDITQASKEVLALRRQFLEGRVNDGAAPSVTLTLEDGTEYAHLGELQFSELTVNQQTGSVLMRASFPNPDQLLLPGMYVRAEVQEGHIENALLVPQRAVMFNREGNGFVYIVEDAHVQRRELNIQRSVDGFWLVNGGVTAGEHVVIEGLQKIADGAPVDVISTDEAGDV